LIYINLDKDKNLAHQEEVLNNAGFTVPASLDPERDAGGTRASLQTGHLIVLILIYIKYSKKGGFDNYAPLCNESSRDGRRIIRTSCNPLDINP